MAALYDRMTYDFAIAPLPPQPLELYDHVLWKIKAVSDDSLLYELDSDIVGLPDWATFPGDPAAALIDWLTTNLTAATGDAPIAYVVPYTGGYAMNHVNATSFNFAADCSYVFGTLAIPGGDFRNYFFEFSMDAVNNEIVNSINDYIAQFGENPILYVAQIKPDE